MRKKCQGHLFLNHHYYNIDVWPTYCQTDFKMVICFEHHGFHQNFYFESRYPEQPHQTGGSKIERKRVLEARMRIFKKKNRHFDTKNVCNPIEDK